MQTSENGVIFAKDDIQVCMGNSCSIVQKYLKVIGA